MGDIRYVVFSDMHLGAENSILTNLKQNSIETDSSKPSPVLIKLVDCLKDVILKNKETQKPKLILNGDLIELALASKNDAAMTFQRFLELTMPENGTQLFDNEIIFLPGNHDHNLWESARSVYYNKKLESLQPGQFIMPEIHMTKLFDPEKINDIFLTTLAQYFQHLDDVVVNTCYPAYAVLSENKSKCVVFCHGHYIESMYHLMTTVISKIYADAPSPTTFAELEIENYAWVDFFWSTLGRSGIVGKDVNLIYDKLQDKKAVNKLIMGIAKNLTNKEQNFFKRFIEKIALYFVLQKTLGKMASGERNEPAVNLSPDATKGLKRLIEIELLNQIKVELDGKVPENVSFLFGHTHKPFASNIKYDGYTNPVKIYNSGGWVVDTLHQQPLHGGSVLLVDDKLDVVALQMYREGRFLPELEEVTNETDKSHSFFYTQLKEKIDFTAEPWISFAKVTEEEVNIRYTNLEMFVQKN